MKHHNSEKNGETHSIPSIGSSISPDYAFTSERAELTTVCFFNSQDYEGVWVPQQLDYSKVTLNNELNAMVQKFAEHFHDSWAARKLDKGWTHGLLYSRRTTNHPRLVPFHRLQDYEKEFYKELCAECFRALVVWEYQFELVDHDANERANQSRVLSGRNERVIYYFLRIFFNSLLIFLRISILVLLIAQEVLKFFHFMDIEFLVLLTQCIKCRLLTVSKLMEEQQLVALL